MRFPLPRYTAFTVEDILSLLSILLADACQADDLIRLLTNVRIHVMGHPVG